MVKTNDGSGEIDRDTEEVVDVLISALLLSGRLVLQRRELGWRGAFRLEIVDAIAGVVRELPARLAVVPSEAGARHDVFLGLAADQRASPRQSRKRVGGEEAVVTLLQLDDVEPAGERVARHHAAPICCFVAGVFPEGNDCHAPARGSFRPSFRARATPPSHAVHHQRGCTFDYGFLNQTPRPLGRRLARALDAVRAGEQGCAHPLATHIASTNSS